MSKLSTNFLKKKVFLSIFFLIWIGATGYLGYHYWLDSNPKKEITEIKKKLSRHVIIDGKDPTIATVTDSNTLKKADPFYKRAENGDKIIIWEDKAILYRPEIDRIIDFGIVLQQPTTVNSAETKNNQATVLILNGTPKRGFAQEIKKEIVTESTKNALIKSLLVRDAKSTGYTKTMIIDLSNGKFSSLIDDLTVMLGAEKGVLPSSENQNVEADIVIILGGNQAIVPSEPPNSSEQ